MKFIPEKESKSDEKNGDPLHDEVSNMNGNCDARFLFYTIWKGYCEVEYDIFFPLRGVHR